LTYKYSSSFHCSLRICVPFLVKLRAQTFQPSRFLYILGHYKTWRSFAPGIHEAFSGASHLLTCKKSSAFLEAQMTSISMLFSRVFERSWRFNWSPLSRVSWSPSSNSWKTPLGNGIRLLRIGHRHLHSQLVMVISWPCRPTLHSFPFSLYQITTGYLVIIYIFNLIVLNKIMFPEN